MRVATRSKQEGRGICYREKRKKRGRERRNGMRKRLESPHCRNKLEKPSGLPRHAKHDLLMPCLTMSTFPSLQMPVFYSFQKSSCVGRVMVVVVLLVWFGLVWLGGGFSMKGKKELNSVVGLKSFDRQFTRGLVDVPQVANSLDNRCPHYV